MSGWEKRFVYPHDFASVPISTMRVTSNDYLWADQIAVKKDQRIYLVSRELVEDSAIDVWPLLRSPSWRQREEWAIRDASIRLRLSRLRKTIARRIDPHYDDDWD